MEFKKVYQIKPKEKKKIAFFSNGPNLPTGYAKVIRELTTRLNKRPEYEIVIISENMFNHPPSEWNGMPVYGVNVPLDQNGNPVRSQIAQGFANLIPEIKPDIVVFLEDSFTLRNFGFENIISMPPTSVFYMPLDGRWIPNIGINVTRTMDYIVAMSKFTQDCLKEEGFDAEMIWHGVDLDLFSPVNEDEQKQLKKKFGFDEDDFIIFNYGRNSNIRKNNHGLLYTMAKYLENAPKNHKFYFHTLEAGHTESDLYDYVERHLSLEFSDDVIDRIFFSGFTHKNPPPDNAVADMIKMSDLVATVSIGEGFGLIMAEAMACKKPVISNDYSTPHELLIEPYDDIGPRGVTVPPAAKFVAALNTEHAYADYDKFVTELHQLTENSEKMKQLGENGRRFAEKYLDWDVLANEWHEFFQRI